MTNDNEPVNSKWELDGRAYLKKYRISWNFDDGTGTPKKESIITYFADADDAHKLANRLQLVSVGYDAKAELMHEGAAAVVALGVTAALDRVAKAYASEHWTHKELRVNPTKTGAREYCVRTLISRDLNAIEAELRKHFALVHDIGCSEGDDPLPDEPPNKWPNSEGLHEWVCILKLRSPQVEPLDLPDSVGVQWAVCWCVGADQAFKDATGKDSLSEATDEEALAYATTDYAYLALMADELGGSQFESHSELCEDSVKSIGQPWNMRLTAKVKAYPPDAEE